MKSFFSPLAAITTSLSFLAAPSAAFNSTDGATCGVLKADDTFFSVVGVQGTGVQPRRELRDLQQDTDVWNLFLQALARFQGTDQNDKISYYQIAGIHGAPFTSWDQVTAQKGQEQMGYCPHMSSLFGTWHRPYLALFEQILHGRAVEIANEYAPGPARNAALALADKVRLPYWDWAITPGNSTDGCMPSILSTPTVSVTFPNGTTGDMANPLYRFDFHPVKYDDFSILGEFQFKNWNHTIRDPLDAYAANATSRNDEANARISKQQPNNRDMLYKILTTYQPFNQVSNKANGGSIGNFETLHDGVHNAFGLGNMGIIEVSAFDPIFWLHHANIDRLIAMYQYRYPDTWVEDAEQKMGTYGMAAGSVQGAATPLSPFHMNANGDIWTSTTSRNWTSFGYTYPEMLSNPSNETFTAVINQLYQPPTQGLSSSNTTIPAPGRNTTNTTSQATDWLCEVKMPANIKISYAVRVFLGEPDSDPRNWATDPNYIGQLATLSSPRMSSDLMISGNIALTDKLAQKYAAGDLKSLAKDHIADYLKANFTWRIQALDQSEIPRDNPPAGLNVTIFDIPITLPKSDTEVPTWNGDVQYHHDIEGNPPVYNSTGTGSASASIPSAQAAGFWNATAGQFQWSHGGQMGVSVSRSPGTQTVTQIVTIGGDDPATMVLPTAVTTTPASSSTSPTASSSVVVSSVAEASVSSSSAAASDPVFTIASPTAVVGDNDFVSHIAVASAPEPTVAPEALTRYITSVVVEYVTM